MHSFNIFYPVSFCNLWFFVPYFDVVPKKADNCLLVNANVVQDRIELKINKKIFFPLGI